MHYLLVPTGGTEKIVSSIADTLSRLLELPVHSIDFTYLENRQKEYHFPNDSLVIIGTPVYAGRIPNKYFFLISRNVS